MPILDSSLIPKVNQWTPRLERNLSLGIAFVLFATYIATRLFSLKTHKSLFVGESKNSPIPRPEAGGEEEEVHEEWSLKKSIVTLLIATIFVALMSEFLVGSVEDARQQLGLSGVFVAIIAIAIIDIGSRVQIALFVAPVLIFASYLFGKPMDMEFTIPEISAVIISAVILSVVIAGQIAGDGESNWLEGVQLLAVYLVLGMLFFFLPEAHQVALAK